MIKLNQARTLLIFFIMIAFSLLALNIPVNGETPTLKPIWHNYLLKPEVCTVDISSDGNLICVHIESLDTKEGTLRPLEYYHMLYAYDGDGNLLWSKNFGHGISSISVSGDGKRIVLGTYSGDFYMLNSSGNVLKSFKVDGYLFADISKNGEYIAVGYRNKDSSIVELLDSNGETIWMCNIPNGLLRGVRVSNNGTILAKTDDGWIFYIKDGSIAWNKSGINSVVMSENGEVVVAVVNRDHVYVFDENGSIKFDVNAEDAEISVSPNGKYVVTANSHSWDSWVISVYRCDGKLLWEKDVNAHLADVAVNDSGYVAVLYDFILGSNVSLYDPCGNLLWNCSTLGWRSFLKTESFLIVSDDLNRIVSFDFTGLSVTNRDGKTVFSKRYGANDLTTDASDDGNTIVIGFDDGNVICFDRNGTVLWNKTFDKVPALARVTSDGRYIILALTYPGRTDVDILVLNRQGNLIWSKNFELSKYVKLSKYGYICIVNENFHFFDVKGYELWNRSRFNDRGIPSSIGAILPDGSAIMIYSDCSGSTILVVNKSGNVTLTVNCPGDVKGVSPTSNLSAFYITMINCSDGKSYLIKLDRDGNVLWTKEIDSAWDVIVKPLNDGRVIMYDRLYPYHIKCFDGNGNLLWEFKGYNGGTYVSNDGKYVLAYPYLLNGTDGSIICTLEPKNACSEFALITSDGRYIIARVYAWGIAVYDLKKLQSTIHEKRSVIRVNLQKVEELNVIGDNISSEEEQSFILYWLGSLWNVKNGDINLTYTITSDKLIQYFNNIDLYENGSVYTYQQKPTINGNNYTWSLTLKGKIYTGIKFNFNDTISSAINDKPWIDVSLIPVAVGQNATRLELTIKPVINVSHMDIIIKAENVLGVICPVELETVKTTSNVAWVTNTEKLLNGSVYKLSIDLSKPKEIEFWIEKNSTQVEKENKSITIPFGDGGIIVVRTTEDKTVRWLLSGILPTEVQHITLNVSSIKVARVKLLDERKHLIGTYYTIKDAVNNASDGYTILVFDGLYRESVPIVDKCNLTISGIGNVRMECSGDYCFHIRNCSKIKISGITMLNGNYSGIWVYNSTDIVLSDCTVKNSGYDVLIESSQGIDVLGLSIIGGVGLTIQDSSGVNVVDFNATNCTYGIWGSGRDILVEDGKFESNDWGIFMGGIDITILGNTFTRNYIGCYIKDADRVNIIDNNFTLNDVSIKFESTRDSVVESNSMVAGKVGVVINNCNNNHFSSNTLDNNTYGLQFKYSKDNIVSRNTIRHSTYAILLNQSNSNLFVLNNITMVNHVTAVDKSNNNIFYLNTFYSIYSPEISDGSSKTHWNTTELIAYVYDGYAYINRLGNQWLYSRCLDKNADGICDTPYRRGSCIDYYPIKNVGDIYILGNLSEIGIVPTFSLAQDAPYYTNKTLTIKVNVFLYRKITTGVWLIDKLIDVFFNRVFTGYRVPLKTPVNVTSIIVKPNGEKISVSAKFKEYNRYECNFTPDIAGVYDITVVAKTEWGVAGSATQVISVYQGGTKVSLMFVDENDTMKYFSIDLPENGLSASLAKTVGDYAVLTVNKQYYLNITIVSTEKSLTNVSTITLSLLNKNETVTEKTISVDSFNVSSRGISTLIVTSKEPFTIDRNELPSTKPYGLYTILIKVGDISITRQVLVTPFDVVPIDKNGKRYPPVDKIYYFEIIPYIKNNKNNLIIIASPIYEQEKIREIIKSIDKSLSDKEILYSYIIPLARLQLYGLTELVSKYPNAEVYIVSYNELREKSRENIITEIKSLADSSRSVIIVGAIPHEVKAVPGGNLGVTVAYKASYMSYKLASEIDKYVYYGPNQIIGTNHYRSKEYAMSFKNKNKYLLSFEGIPSSETIPGILVCKKHLPVLQISPVLSSDLRDKFSNYGLWYYKSYKVGTLVPLEHMYTFGFSASKGPLKAEVGIGHVYIGLDLDLRLFSIVGAFTADKVGDEIVLKPELNAKTSLGSIDIIDIISKKMNWNLPITIPVDTNTLDYKLNKWAEDLANAGVDLKVKKITIGEIEIPGTSYKVRDLIFGFKDLCELIFAPEPVISRYEVLQDNLEPNSVHTILKKVSDRISTENRPLYNIVRDFRETYPREVESVNRNIATLKGLIEFIKVINVLPINLEMGSRNYMEPYRNISNINIIILSDDIGSITYANIVQYGKYYKTINEIQRTEMPKKVLTTINNIKETLNYIDKSLKDVREVVDVASGTKPVHLQLCFPLDKSEIDKEISVPLRKDNCKYEIVTTIGVNLTNLTIKSINIYITLHPNATKKIFEKLKLDKIFKKLKDTNISRLQNYLRIISDRFSRIKDIVNKVADIVSSSYKMYESGISIARFNVNQLYYIGDPTVKGYDDPITNGTITIEPLPSRVYVNISSELRMARLLDIAYIKPLTTKLNVTDNISAKIILENWEPNTGAYQIPSYVMSILYPENQTITNIICKRDDPVVYHNITLMRTVYIIGNETIPGVLEEFERYPPMPYIVEFSDYYYYKHASIWVFPAVYYPNNKTLVYYRNISLVLDVINVPRKSVDVRLNAYPNIIGLSDGETANLTLVVYNSVSSKSSTNVAVTITHSPEISVYGLNNYITVLGTSPENRSLTIPLKVKAPDSVTDKKVYYVNISVTYYNGTGISIDEYIIPVIVYPKNYVDVVVKDVVVPSTMYIGHSYKIKATITNAGRMAVVELPVRLYIDDELINVTTISLINPGQSKTVEFTFKPDHASKHKIIVAVPAVVGESNLDNNIYSVYVDVSAGSYHSGHGVGGGYVVHQTVSGGRAGGGGLGAGGGGYIVTPTPKQTATPTQTPTPVSTPVETPKETVTPTATPTAPTTTTKPAKTEKKGGILGILGFEVISAVIAIAYAIARVKRQQK